MKNTLGTDVALLICIAGMCVCGGCSEPRATPVKGGSMVQSDPTHSVDMTVAPGSGQLLRVGGDLDKEISGTDGAYSCGPCDIDTPLPAGYPKPTPPGAIDLKTYPVVRRAEVAGTGDPDSGMNGAFWPLFNHIKKHDIAMTSPVEMNYGDESESKSREWSMAFLYREREMNATGTEGKVVVKDAQSLTVLSIGMKGNYSSDLVARGEKELDAWLAAHPQWKRTGGVRALYYNGPALMWWNKWAEVQVEVRPASQK